ncbi:SpoIIE family protein phosphatase [Leptolyngbya sp. FACHB-671]|uniref:PP2C family protein-serine/threonine phosphatase n=1 Tax=unclassified Leptolyngbya TaxID=2650499 RepID=UPI00168838E0|nr:MULTISPECIES: SpoIIE family protein phosphatase [unclassified Leptolyngbya]MBD1999831.1 SpoIIE family protein phosphatase [Leptolyngbya sp. FACHB-541]MBD2071032.1 SpoIIE family protein phosphatase [Leptolyngbya sp. FACHB-671]
MAQILVIDDDPIIRLILRKSLQGQGHTVTTVDNGEAGLEQAQNLHPALIICDWMMPGIDGLEVCRQVKSNLELSTTFFILLTARGATADRVQGLDTGADDFLAKPIELTELQARVRAGLRLHQLTRDLQTQKQLLEAELAEAAEYVRSLLPAPLVGKISIDARFIPSRQLGGDCFDYFWLDPDYLVIYLLDVSGHGLGAALPSIAVLNLLRSQSLPDVNFYQPHDVLRGLNETFQMNSQNEKYFTIWYGVYNQAKRQMTYASAGHPPAVLASNTENGALEVQLLKTPALPVGMLTDVSFTSSRCEIPVGGNLYVFSDGVYEIRQTNEEIWGLEPFIDLLTKQGNTSNLDELLETVHLLSNEAAFNDDLSLLRVRFD